MNRAFISAALIATVFAMVPNTARAGQASATMQVTLTVQPACRVSATPLSFSGEAGQAIDGEARIAVACNGDIPVSVTLDGGAHSSGGERRLVSGEGGYVAYALYSDPTRQSRWSAGQPVSAIPQDGRLELAAYGRVEPGATLSANGAYQDIVAVTVDF